MLGRSSQSSAEEEEIMRTKLLSFQLYRKPWSTSISSCSKWCVNNGFNLGALQQRKRKEKAELAVKEHYELKTVEVEWIEISRHEFCEKARIGTFSLSVTIEGSSAEIQRSRRPMTLTDQGPSPDPSPEALEQLRECECAQFQRHFKSYFFRDLKVKRIQRKIWGV